MNDSEVREFLDSVEAADSVEEARQLADSDRYSDDIDQLVELAQAHTDGRTTHRSIAEQVGIDRSTVWRALEVLPPAFGWETGTESSRGG